MTEQDKNMPGAGPTDAGEMLDDLFTEARSQGPQPSDAFLARMEAIALEEQPAPRASLEQREVKLPKPSLWAQAREAVGGWIGVAGLATACAAGLWIGVNPPEAVNALWTDGTTGLGALGVDPLNGFDLSVLEG